ncbi:membrane-spanning 4-domains subfamily A member 8-like isoform X2 [Hyperolius riggenbachi]
MLVVVTAVLKIIFDVGWFASSYYFRTSIVAVWSSIFCIIAGALTLAAGVKFNTCLIQGSLALNILSSMGCVVALIFNCMDLAFFYCYGYYYPYDRDDTYITHCRKRYAHNTAFATVLIIVNLLLLSVTITSSVFGCRSLYKSSSAAPQMLNVPDNVVIPMDPNTIPLNVTLYTQASAPTTTHTKAVPHHY